MRLETLGALAAFSAAVLAIESRGAASQMGLTLSYALQITSLTSMTVRLASVAENAFNAVERMAEYSKLKEEAAAVIRDSAPPDWPSAGKVQHCGTSIDTYVQTPPPRPIPPPPISPIPQPPVRHLRFAGLSVLAVMCNSAPLVLPFAEKVRCCVTRGHTHVLIYIV